MTYLDVPRSRSIRRGRAASRALFLSLALLLAPARAEVAAPDVKPVLAHHAMVVTQEKRASQVGLQVLEKGGNAIDAAVAVGFALAVTHPQAGNLGGGGFMLVRLAGGTAVTIDYR